MGRRDVEAIGGFSISLLLPPSPSWDVGLAVVPFSGGPGLTDSEGKPEMTGGGNSIPSAAFFDNCLAKSDACHHSKNLSAKILVGSKIFKLPSKRGPNVLGLKIELTPKLPPGAVGLGASNPTIAL